MTQFRTQVRRALIWRSGMQIAAQSLQWMITLVVIRLLVPRDYGLVAMAEVITSFLTILAGYSFTSAIIQAPEIDERRIRQFFGLLIVINLGLAALQFAAAPLVASYYREPMVASMLRVQALNYLFIPFITLPLALASRKMEFRSPALVHFFAMMTSGATVMALAWTGFGVWALVIGTVVLHASRAVGMAVATRWLMRPIFRFDGTASLLTYGGAVMANSILWFFYSQADIFIGGRVLKAHDLGIYSTGLFLASLPVSKFIPALNEVGFTAYARIQDDLKAVHFSFLKSTRMVTLLFFPVFLGLAAVADNFVPVVLGPQWIPAAPIIRTIALVMPLYAIYTLLTPVVNALGQPRVGLTNSLIGLVIMPAAFFIGVRWGAIGLARAWAFGFPLLFLITTWRSLRVMKLGPLPLLEAMAPALLSSALMAAAVYAGSRMIRLSALFELGVLIAIGAAVYIATVALLFPKSRHDLTDFIRR